MPITDRILLFDLGNILVTLNSVDTIWSDATSDGATVIQDDYWAKSPAVHDYETGKIPSLKAFYEAIRTELPIKVSEDEFYRIFHQAIGAEFPQTHRLLTDLKQQYPLFLLSNTSEAHWRICRDQKNLGQYFTRVFVSYELGVMKPDPVSFQRAIAGIGTDPHNIWFYDDREENVREAINHGMNAFVSFGGEPLINDLRSHGFLT